jgi:hypothetical protein
MRVFVAGATGVLGRQLGRELDAVRTSAEAGAIGARGLQARQDSPPALRGATFLDAAWCPFRSPSFVLYETGPTRGGGE